MRKAGLKAKNCMAVEIVAKMKVKCSGLVYRLRGLSEVFSMKHDRQALLLLFCMAAQVGVINHWQF